MPFSELGWAWIVLLVLFAGIFLALVVHLARTPIAGGAQPEDTSAPPSPATSGTLAQAMRVPGAVPEPYLLRFVHDAAGEQVGETLSMSEGHVILKREGRFHAVPLEAVAIEDDELVVRDVDWEAAAQKGDAWRDAQRAQHEALEFDAERE